MKYFAYVKCLNPLSTSQHFTFCSTRKNKIRKDKTHLKPHNSPDKVKGYKHT